MPDTNDPNGPRGIYVLPPADVSRVSRSILDLPYGGDSPFQKLDIYLPSEAEARGKGRPLPVIIYVHGGAWKMCDKKDCQVEPALAALARGWAVVSVNYRLSSEAIFPAPVDDVRAALSWLVRNAVEHGLDGQRIALWGESAGAHLVSHAGLREPSLVKAVVAWYCPTNFSKMDPYLAENGFPIPDHSLPGSPESELLGAPIGEVPRLVRAADPQSWLTPEAPPFLLQHGRKDDIVAWQLSRDFAARFDAICGPGRATLEILEGAGHATEDFRTHENVQRVIAYLEKRI